MPSTIIKCPGCKQPVYSEDPVCGRCGAQLHIICPSCGQMTFIQSNCRHCRTSLYVICPKEDCGWLQLISPDNKCRYCGGDIEPNTS